MEYVAVAVLVVVSVGAVVYLQSRRNRHRREAVARFESLPLTAIADSLRSDEPGGVDVRVVGTIRASADVPASVVSGRSFVVCDLEVRGHSSGGRPRTASGTQSVDFLLDDGTATALVRVSGATVALDRDPETARIPFNDGPPLARQLLEAAGTSGLHNTIGAEVSFREGVLAPGDRAEVVCRPVPADEEALALGAAVVLRADPGSLLIRTPPAAPDPA